jgi:plasmid stability protein
MQSLISMANEVHMATLTIRNLDDDLKASLRVQAAHHGRSMEEEVRSILRQVLSKPTSTTGLGQRLVSRFQAVATDLPIPPRSQARTPPDWEETA